MRTDEFPDLARVIVGAAFALALMSSASSGAAPAPATPTTTDAAAAQPLGAHRSGLIAVVPGHPDDPDGPASAASSPGGDALLADPELAAALSTSSEGLYEENLPDGGVMVRLQGRFRSVLFASVSPDGAVHRTHRPLSPAAFALAPEENSCRPLPAAAGEVSHATP